MGNACFDDLRFAQDELLPASRDRSVRLGLHRPRRTSRMVLSLLVVGLVVVALVSYTLRFIPFFDITSIKATAIGGFNALPQRSAVLLAAMDSTSLFAFNPRHVERELEKSAVVKEAQVRRILPSTLSIKLSIESPGMLIAAVDDQDKVSGIFMVKQGELREIPFEDFQLFGNKVFVVQVSPAYASYLATYGLDDGIRQVVQLANDMGIDEDSNYNLITKIKYDNNSSNNFGRMVLYLPSCNAQLWIREPVSVFRLHEAVRLIEFEHDRDKTRNIALKGELRYDLYANSLVSRQ